MEPNMNLPLHKSDHLLFLRSWISRPLQVAAVAPSSRWLAAAITAEVPRQGEVLELGPGTGAFTRALLRHGVDERALTLVERNPDFAALLRARFPAATVLERDASILPIGRSGFGAAVSGLPLLSMPAAQVGRILAAAFASLAEDAPLFQFTYGPRCPVPENILHGLGLAASFRRFVPLNLPPASVYRIARQPLRQ
jgi:phosphatidylethanolamine/phosphatidyl-N-methylethanolamine N-methyltransferase